MFSLNTSKHSTSVELQVFPHFKAAISTVYSTVMTKVGDLLHSIVRSILCQLVEGLRQTLDFCGTAGLP